MLLVHHFHSLWPCAVEEAWRRDYGDDEHVDEDRQTRGNIHTDEEKKYLDSRLMLPLNHSTVPRTYRIGEETGTDDRE